MIGARRHHAHPRLLLLLLLASPASATEDIDWQMDLERIIDVAGESLSCQLAPHRARPLRSHSIAARVSASHQGPASASARPGALCTGMGCLLAQPYPATADAACASVLPL